MLAFLIGLASFIAVVAAAIRGVSYRGIYFALALCALIIGLIVTALIPSTPQILAAETPEARAGSQFLFDNGPGFVVWCFALAFAGLVGGVAFRARQ